MLAYPTFVDLMRARAAQQPDRVAYIFLKNGEQEESRVTYGELEERAIAIATHLHTIVNPGDRVLLVYPYDKGQDFIQAFLGCLYAGVIAVPSHPPRNRYSIADLMARLRTAQAKAILTNQSYSSKLKRQLHPHCTAQDQHQWLITSSLPQGTPWTPPQLTPEDLAFLQYTSGSTGVPKGVMICHRNLLHNQEMLQAAFGHTAASVGIGWLPLFHDMGLIGNALQALYLGASSVLMSPLAFIQKPVRWLQAISRYQGTTSGGPNFAYDLLCRHVTEQELDTLDLSHWEIAFSGAESVRAATLDAFSQKFAPCGFRRAAFYPCYGMAEATLFITGGDKAQPPHIKQIQAEKLAQNQAIEADTKNQRVQTFVSCGRPWLGSQIAIIDPPTGQRCAPHEIGEIWVQSPGNGQGYWQQPEKSHQTFENIVPDTGDGPFLRTGDLGFFLDNELFITGRLHDVLVFYGLNHYPQHIEQTVAQCYAGLRSDSGAAFSVSIQGENRLVIAQEVERNARHRLDVRAVALTAHWAVFDAHFVDLYALILIKPGGLPKTPSGKIQRSACRQQFLDGTLQQLDAWQKPASMPSDIPTLIRYYLNPLSHLRRYLAQVRGQWQLCSFGGRSTPHLG